MGQRQRYARGYNVSEKRGVFNDAPSNVNGSAREIENHISGSQAAFEIDYSSGEIEVAGYIENEFNSHSSYESNQRAFARD